MLGGTIAGLYWGPIAELRISGSQRRSRIRAKTGSRKAVTDSAASSGVASGRSGSTRQRSYGFQQVTSHGPGSLHRPAKEPVLLKSGDVLGGEHRAFLRRASGINELIGIGADPCRVEERPARRVDPQSLAERPVLVSAMPRSVQPDPCSGT